MLPPKISVVIPAHNEAPYLSATIDTLHKTTGANLPFEVVVVDDASTDGCADGLQELWPDQVRVFRSTTPRGVAGARNFGATQARAPILLFLDGHCYLENGALAHMTKALHRLGRGMVVPQVIALGDPSARGFGMTLASENLCPSWLPFQFEDPHPVPIGCGCAQMMFKSWFEQIGRYDQMRRYGVEDLEISVRSWLLGGAVYVVPRAVVAHRFKTQTTCDVTWSEMVYNALRMAHLHFSNEPLHRIVTYWKSFDASGEAEQWLQASDYRERRGWLDKRRRHSVEWFCEKFSISF